MMLVMRPNTNASTRDRWPWRVDLPDQASAALALGAQIWLDRHAPDQHRPVLSGWLLADRELAFEMVITCSP